MNETTALVAGKVASLVPNVLPSVAAAASYIVPICIGSGCSPVWPERAVIIVFSDYGGIWSYFNGCCQAA